MYLDLLRMSEYGEILAGTKWLGTETEQQFSIIWPGSCHRNENATMRVRVRGIQVPTRRLDITLENTQILRQDRFTYCKEYVQPDFPYMIMDECIPTLVEFEYCKNDAVHSCWSGPLVGLQDAFASFFSRYCSLDRDLPLVSVLDI
jgi:hypothetical protein